MVTHTIDLYWIPSQNKTKSKLQIWKISQKFKFWNFAKNLYTRHTFWSCLIRCVIWTGSGYYCESYRADTIMSTDGWTDGQTDRRTDDVKPVYPPFNFVEAEGIIAKCCDTQEAHFLLHVTKLQNWRGRIVHSGAFYSSSLIHRSSQYEW